jgi:LacI family transcriptional regulator
VNPPDSPRNATINDLAAAAGVSNATVSRVLNGSSRVSPETRDRVLAMAERMNYVPNAVARSLRSSSSSEVVLIVPDITIDYFCRIGKALGERLRALGYLTSIIDCGFGLDTEARVVMEVIKARPAAVVLASVSPEATSRPEYLDLLERAGIPVVLLDRPLGTDRFPLVGLDHDDGATKCARLIAEKGWRRVHILSGPDSLYAMRTRVRAAVGELNRSGVAYALHIEGMETEATARTVARILAEEDPAEARFFSLNSTKALGAIPVLIGAGLTLKDHLVSFDEVPLAAAFGHRLSCIRYSCDRIAEEVTALLAPTLTDGAPLPRGAREVPGEIERV